MMKRNFYVGMGLGLAVGGAAMLAMRPKKSGVKTVVGFTGSAIWKYVAMFPPASQAMIDANLECADRAYKEVRE